MRILILGASGFIGTHLVCELGSSGHEVIARCRSGLVAGFTGNCRAWELGNSIEIPPDVPIDCAIHLAHDFGGVAGAKLTIEGTMRSVMELRRCGVVRQIFFSSYSARPNAPSVYGRTKYLLEQSLGDNQDVTIIRPGLVIGGGGIYGRIEKAAGILPIIPLPDGGRGLVPVIDIDRLCSETIRLATARTISNVYNLFEPRLLSLRELTIGAAQKKGRRPIILPLPSPGVLLILTALEKLRIPLPVKADNLRGFIGNQQAGHVSDLGNEQYVSPDFTATARQRRLPR